jgi:hypothetical protein
MQRRVVGKDTEVKSGVEDEEGGREGERGESDRDG